MFCKYKIFQLFFTENRKKSRKRDSFPTGEGRRPAKRGNGRLPFGRNGVGEAVSAVVADVVLDGDPLDIVDVAAADEDRIVFRDAQLGRDALAGQPGRDLLDGGVDDDIVLGLKQFVERHREVVVAADREARVEVGDEDHERIFGMTPHAFELQTERAGLALLVQTEEAAHLLVGILQRDVQLVVLDRDSEPLHLLRKAQPVLHAARDGLLRHPGSVALAAAEQPLEDHLVDGLAQCIARNVQIASEFYLVGQQFAVLILGQADHLLDRLLGQDMQRFILLPFSHVSSE